MGTGKDSTSLFAAVLGTQKLVSSKHFGDPTDPRHKLSCLSTNDRADKAVSDVPVISEENIYTFSNISVAFLAREEKGKEQGTHFVPLWNFTQMIDISWIF